MTSILCAVGRLGPVLLAVLLLAACGSTPPPADRAVLASDAWAQAGWRHWSLPGKQTTDYKAVVHGERSALEVRASSSASLMRRPLNLAASDLGAIRFSWKVPALVPQADLAQRDKADAVVRVVLTFEGDRSRLSARDHMLSELALLMTGEPMPYATLMYVWCPTRAAGSVIVNPRTDRIRKLVVESGTARLNQWLDYERDIRADFRQVFGEEPGRLLNVAVMSDGDNTHSTFRAWYGPVLVEGLDVARSD